MTGIASLRGPGFSLLTVFVVRAVAVTVACLAGDGREQEHGVHQCLDAVAHMSERDDLPGNDFGLILAGDPHSSLQDIRTRGRRGVVLGEDLSRLEPENGLT